MTVNKNQLTPLPQIDRLPDAHNPPVVYLASLTSRTSVATMQSSLRVLSDMLGFEDYTEVPWHKLTYAHTMRIRTLLIEKYDSNNTVNRYLSLLRGVLKQAWQLGLMASEQYHRAINIPSLTIRKDDVDAGRYITEDEITALFETCADKRHIDWRDAAMLALMLGTGMRRNEVATMMMDDYDPEDGKITIMGKGKKVRTFYIANSQKDVLDHWLHLRGQNPGKLFNPVYKNGRIDTKKGITAQNIYKMLSGRVVRAGILKKTTPHDFRRTAISNMFDNGVDASTLSKIVGHSNIATTGKYDRRKLKQRQQAAEDYSISVSLLED